MRSPSLINVFVAFGARAPGASALRLEAFKRVVRDAERGVSTGHVRSCGPLSHGVWRMYLEWQCEADSESEEARIEVAVYHTRTVTPMFVSWDR